MELKEIASISGKEGLYRVLKPSRTGVIVETLDAQKKKMAIGAAGKVSILKEISIYTTTKDGSVPLQDVLIAIHDKYQDKLPIDPKASAADLMQFLGSVLPEFDTEKVYPSDVKKLVKWYNILWKEAPEVLQKQEVVEAKEEAIEEKPKEATTEKKAEEVASETKEEQPKETTTKKKTEEVASEAKEEKPKKTTAKKKTEEVVASETKEEKPKKTTAKKKTEEVVASETKEEKTKKATTTKAKKETEEKEAEEKPKKSSRTKKEA
jgi:hypothetical protein